MKRLLMALAVLALFGGAASASFNEGGTIFLHDPGVLYTTDIEDYCGQGVAPASCEAADVEVPATAEYHVVKMYAAFPEGATPRLKGISFGVYYDPAEILILGGAPCPAGTFELPDTGWPAAGTGNSLVWDMTITEMMPELYWFYGYAAYAPGLFTLGPDAFGFGEFGDDSLPPLTDPIAGFGSLGFGIPGLAACPGAVPEPGACCDELGNCTFVLETECPGTFLGVGIPCDPNPCPPVPTEESTWGQIKNSYR